MGVGFMRRWGREEKIENIRNWLDDELESDAMDIDEIGFWYGYIEEAE